jgi:hypothetical protein
VIGRGRSHGTQERSFPGELGPLGLTCEARVGLVASLLEHPAAIWQSGEEDFGLKHLVRESKIFNQSLSNP